MKSTHQNPSGNNQTPTEWATYHLASNRVATNSFAPAIAPAPGSVQMDADGRLLYDGSKSYLWEAQGTLCGVTTAAGNHYQYFYDAEGRRVTVTSRSDANCAFGTTTLADYILDQAGRQITELDGNGHWKHTNIYANGELLATYDPAGTHFALSDWLGDKRVQASAAGVAELSCWNFPFNDDFGCTATDATEHRYTGKEHDPLTGIDLFGAREFTGYSGRFLSPDWSDEDDPVPYADPEDPQSLNLYAYVGNNPLSNVDDDGHDGAAPAQTCTAWCWLRNLFNGGGGGSTPLPPGAAAVATSDFFSGAGKGIGNSFQSAANLINRQVGAPQHPLDTLNGPGEQQGAMAAGIGMLFIPGPEEIEALQFLSRDGLLAEVTNPKLRAAIKELYREGAHIGDGSTAAAIEHELSTGEAVGGRFHSTKGAQSINRLRRLLREQNLSPRERAIAGAIITRTTRALGLTGGPI